MHLQVNWRNVEEVLMFAGDSNIQVGSGLDQGGTHTANKSIPVV
jgi:hypothetical protein